MGLLSISRKFLVLNNMNYSTWEKSRWYIYSCGGKLNSQGKVTKDNDIVSILHLGLNFKIINILDNFDEYVKLIIVVEENKTDKKVTYKEKQELKKILKQVCKDYIKNRLEKGFEYELFTVK